jgi:hypothetical protein
MFGEEQKKELWPRLRVLQAPGNEMTFSVGMRGMGRIRYGLRSPESREKQNSLN